MPRLALHTCTAIFAALTALTPATADSQASEAGRVEIAALEQVYLDCERRAIMAELDTGEIMKCSMVYEELKRRAFGGDFKRLKAWADARIAAEAL